MTQTAQTTQKTSPSRLQHPCLGAAKPHLPDLRLETIRMLRIGKVEVIVGYRKSKIYQMIQEGTFPAGYKLGPKATAWRSDEVYAWIAGLPKSTTSEPEQ